MNEKQKSKLTRNEISWILYDCGNSAYSIGITTALLPVYFGMFNGGSSMDLGYFNSLASILVAVLSPILGTIADYRNFKKRFFTFFFLVGVAFTAGLAVVPNGQVGMLVTFYILTCVGFAGANIFYDSFIVDITSDDRMDRVSASGFAYGYIASVIPFAISLAVIFFMGMDNMAGYQIGFGIVAVWWGLFTIPFLKNAKQIHYVEREKNPIGNSFKRLIQTFKNIKQYKIVFAFLIAYFLYIDGVDTIIKMCVPYSTDVLGLDSGDTYLLLGILLVIQIVAFPFALMYGRLAKKHGTKKMIIVAICTYIASCIFGSVMFDVWNVFILGIMIGSAQGGIQALSRSYFAKIIPKQNSNEFFGFYNIFGKFAAIIGPFLMALIDSITGMPRLSIIAILPLFIAGLILMVRLPEQRKEGTEA